MNKILMTLTGMLLILACSRESNLVDPAANLKSSAKDSLPGDTTPIDTTDTIPHYPTDSVFRKIKGLVITPSSVLDSTLNFHIETSTNYPVAHSRVNAFFGHSPDSLNISVYGVEALYPYTPGSAPAKTDLWRAGPGTGTHPLSIYLSGHTYTGSISLTGSNYTISWAHDSIILISPKTFPR